MRAIASGDGNNAQKEEAADLVDRSRDTREPASTRLLASFLPNHQICDLCEMPWYTQFVSMVLTTRGLISTCRTCCLASLLEVSTAVVVSRMAKPATHNRRLAAHTKYEGCVSTLCLRQLTTPSSSTHRDSVVDCRHSRRKSYTSTCSWRLLGWRVGILESIARTTRCHDSERVSRAVRESQCAGHGLQSKAEPQSLAVHIDLLHAKIAL